MKKTIFAIKAVISEQQNFKLVIEPDLLPDGGKDPQAMPRSVGPQLTAAPGTHMTEWKVFTCSSYSLGQAT